jgi:hypothetical protein
MRASGAAAILAIAFVSASCGNLAGPSSTASTYADYLYMTDTVSGKVFAYDPATQVAASSSYATTGKNATGEIQFYKGIGYAAVGSGTGEGAYYFDPSAASPSFSKLGGTSGAIAAQYFAFYSATKAFVSSFDYSGTTSGLYYFNPASPSSDLVAVSSMQGKYLQELCLGSDGYLYAADNANKAVYRINPSSGALIATISTNAKGTTGLVAGSYDGASGIFVANTGGYDSSYSALPGTIDFIASSAADGSTATLVAKATSASASIYPARIVQLSGGKLVATGYGHSYFVTLSGSSASAAELKNSSGASFGGLDIANKDGLVYIPVAETSDYVSYKDYLYVLDSSGGQKSYSPVSVMSSSEGISNIGFYEN